MWAGEALQPCPHDATKFHKSNTTQHNRHEQANQKEVGPHLMIGFNSMNGGEPAARYRWTGRVWDITGWTSRLYESHPIITIVENYMKKNHIRFFLNAVLLTNLLCKSLNNYRFFYYFLVYQLRLWEFGACNIPMGRVCKKLSIGIWHAPKCLKLQSQYKKEKTCSCLASEDHGAQKNRNGKTTTFFSSPQSFLLVL